MDATFSVPGRKPRSWLAPSEERSERRAAPHVERADALGGVELVTGDGEQIDVELAHAAPAPCPPTAPRRCERPHRTAWASSRELGDGLEHAGLVVRVHHRDERGVAVDGFPGRVDAGTSFAIDPDARDPVPVPLQPVARACGRRVLDARGDDVPAPLLERTGHATDREIVRLGAARGEEHLVGVAAEQRGDLLPGARDGLSSTGAVRMRARWVPEVLAQVREHRVDDLGQKRRRRVVVQVDGVWAHARSFLSSAAIGRKAALRSVSLMRTATTVPDAKVSAATSHIAAGSPSASAVTPASSAPTA